MPAGKAKIRTIDRNKIKSKGNLPIPHSEKARANVGNGIFFLLRTEFILEFLILVIGLAKIIEIRIRGWWVNKK